MWEGLIPTVFAKAWDSGAKLFGGKKKDEAEVAQLHATATKLVAETTHLETGTVVQKQQLEIVARQAMHERIVWFCDPFRLECAKACQAFATQAAQTFVRFAVMLQTNPDPNEQLVGIVNETMGKLLDTFANALPYMHSDIRDRFGNFLNASAKAAGVVRGVDRETSKEKATTQLQTAYNELDPELKVLVSPLDMYSRFMDESDKAKQAAAEEGAKSDDSGSIAPKD